MTTWTIGMRVAVSAGVHLPPTILTISAISAGGKIITTDDGRKWNPGGYLRGQSRDRWTRTRIVPATPDLEEEAERAAFVSRLSRVKWSALPLDDLRKIAGVLDGRRGNHDDDPTPTAQRG